MFFVDGFNLYHSLKEDPHCRRFLWLDLVKLANRFKKNEDELVGVYYFSALAIWKPESVKRHQIFLSALKNRNVQIVLGEFKTKDRYCYRCRSTLQSREEKQTDVNIAIYLLEEAFKDHYDTAFILSGDTDLVPAILSVKRNFANKRIGVLFPINRWANELKTVCHFWRKIDKKDLSQSQFPDQISLPSGAILNRPLTWL